MAYFLNLTLVFALKIIYFLYGINNGNCSLQNWGILLFIIKSIFSKHFSQTLKKVKRFWKAYHVYTHYDFPILLILFYVTSLHYASSNKYKHSPASYFYDVKTYILFLYRLLFQEVHG